MKFGRIPLDEAEGAILAHGLKVDGGTLKKGQRLAVEDIANLRAAGHSDVVAARLEADDLDENAAAETLARAAAGEALRVSPPFTGRCNLYAEQDGVVVLDRGRLDRVNLLDEALTIATVTPHESVNESQLVATVKVIPLAAPRAVVEAAATIAAEPEPLLRLAPFRPHQAGLILSALPGLKESVLEKTATTVGARLERWGSRLATVLRCAHEEGAIEEAIRTLLDKGCAPILIFGASAIIDRRDVVPRAIEQAGGEIEHFGMPVDPGNLLLLARVGGTPVLGLPGSARSPRLNGFDWILQRLLAGLPVTGRDLMLLGGGGLLKEMPGRPQPREDGRPRRRAPAKVAALVLAAGRSRRMGSINKLLSVVDEKPMVAHVADAALASGADPVVVVVGHEGERVRTALAGRPLEFVDNPDYAEGLSTSLRHGIGALEAGVAGVLVCLGDMPRVTAKHLDMLIAAFDPAAGHAVCVPTCRGKRGNPVLWGRAFFAEIMEVEGDVGARHLIGEHAEEVVEVAIEDEAIFVDVDTPEAFAALGPAKTPE